MSSSSSFPPGVPQHCSTVPVLFELLKGEEEHCRVWLRDQMKQIPDPLIDSLFSRLIMSSSSSSAVPQSRLTVSELCGLLEGEEVEVKRILGGEMNRLVNTLFEILTNKLRTNTDLDRSEDGGDCAQVGNRLHQIDSHNPQSHERAFLIPKTLTSTFGHYSHGPHSNGDELELNTVEMIEIKEEVEDGEETRLIDIETFTELNKGGGAGESRSGETTQQMVCVKQEIKEEFDSEEEIEIKKEEEEDGETQISDIDVEAQGNQSGAGESSSEETTQQMVCVQPEIKGEFDYGHEIEINDIEGEDNQDGGDESRSVESAPMDTTSARPIGQVNKLSGRVEKRKQTDEEPQPQAAQVRNDAANRDNEDADAGEGTSRPVKRPSRPTTSNDPQEMQIITVTLRCPQLGCGEIAKDEFKAHMWNRHSIGLFRCAVKDCDQSFDNKRILGQHVKVAHSDITQWHCDKCSKHFTTYQQVSSHSIYQHQLGHFKCSFPTCTFTGECRMKMYNHYREQHKDKPEFVCQQSGCVFRTKHSTRFKEHQLAHLGAKPFHCKWPDCHYFGALQDTVMKHIQRSHFKSSSSTDLTHLGKPKDYLEVVR